MIAANVRPSRYLTLFLVLFILSTVYYLDSLIPRYRGLPVVHNCLDPELAHRARLAKIANYQENSTLRHLFGSRTILDSPNHCYNSSARLRPYGFTVEDQYGAGVSLWEGRVWSEEQHRCAVKNGYVSDQPSETPRRFRLPDQVQDQNQEYDADQQSRSRRSRTAVVLRATESFDWAGDLIPFIRSMIVELSLETGGLYEVFILVHIEDPSQHIFIDAETYDRVLRKSVPEEFQDMAYLWNENLLRQWYPSVKNHSFIHQAYQALQLFSNVVKPEFDYFWQFEMDFRTSSPHLQNLERLSSWAKDQPRFLLQNMNAAWYLPNQQGSWGDLFNLMNETLWDDKLAAQVQEHGLDWGAGEEADLITLAPIIDIRRTKWLFRGMVHNDPYQTKDKNLPHFAAPVSMTRTSKRLLHEVHALQQHHGFWMASEATMETVAARKGLKAVHAQHPVYYNGTESDSMLDWLFNSGNPDNLGGGAESQYNWEGAAHRVLEKLTWWWPREGYDHYSQNVWSDFLIHEACLPAGLFHPFKWHKFSPPST